MGKKRKPKRGKRVRKQSCRGCGKFTYLDSFGQCRKCTAGLSGVGSGAKPSPTSMSWSWGPPKKKTVTVTTTTSGTGTAPPTTVSGATMPGPIANISCPYCLVHLDTVTADPPWRINTTCVACGSRITLEVTHGETFAGIDGTVTDPVVPKPTAPSKEGRFKKKKRLAG